MAAAAAVGGEDVVRVMLQYLKENNLLRSFECLQNESDISLNTVESVEGFVGDVVKGKWDVVLTQMHSMRLPREKVVPVYEQVVFELLESGERELAREFVRSTPSLVDLKKDDAQRYLRLEHLCQRPLFNASDVYEYQSSKEKRRQEIADALRQEVSTVEPSRLLVLLGQALRYQQSAGLLPADAVRFDLFANARKAARRDLEEKPVRRLAGSIRFAPESHPETAVFSPAAGDESLVTGSFDGFVEVWDYEACQLRKDLPYQASEPPELMAHDKAEAVLCSAFSRDGLLLATGSASGQIKVWKLASGECLRKFPQAHPQGVTSLSFSRDCTQLLSTSFDHSVRLHGIKSGKTLKQFDGHTSYVNCACFSSDGNTIFSGSSDGCVRVWDARTCDCLATLRPGAQAGSVVRDCSIHTLQLVPHSPDHLFVVPKGGAAFVMSPSGETLRTLSLAGAGAAAGAGVGRRDFLCATLSPQGKLAYCMGEDGVLTVFDLARGAVEESVIVCEGGGADAAREIIAVTHHPHRNLLVTLQDDGCLKIWKP